MHKSGHYVNRPSSYPENDWCTGWGRSPRSKSKSGVWNFLKNSHSGCLQRGENWKLLQLKALGILAAWLPWSVSGSIRQGFGDRDIHQLPVHFLTVSMACYSGEQWFELGVGCWAVLMSLAYRWYSRGQELPAPDRDLIGLVVLSYALSCQRASEGADFHITAVVRHWRLLLEVRRSQCPL